MRCDVRASSAPIAAGAPTLATRSTLRSAAFARASRSCVVSGAGGEVSVPDEALAGAGPLVRAAVRAHPSKAEVQKWGPKLLAKLSSSAGRVAK